MPRRSTLVPTPSLTNRAALPPHKKASQAQLARRKIRKWAQFLPEDEAVTFRAQLNQTEKELRRKKKEELQHQYTWSNVPGEVRNMIYEYLMVQESPIAPVVEKKLIRKHDLGANFLLSGKAVLNEALPVLFGANTFEVNVHFHHILGDSRVGRLARGKLFKKVLINNAAVTGESRSFNKLTNLDTCIIVERGWPNAHSNDMDFDSAAFSAFERRSALAVRKFISRNPDTKFYFLYDVEHRVSQQNNRLFARIG